MAVGNIMGYLPSTGRARATAVITAAMQYTDWQAAFGFDHLTLFFEYVRGAAGGQVQWVLEVRDAGYLGTYQASAEGLGVTAVNVDTANIVQRATETYGATGAADEGWTFDIAINRNIHSFRIGFLEVGVPGTPGNFGVDWQMSTVL